MKYLKLYEQYNKTLKRYEPWGVGMLKDDNVYIHKNYFNNIPEDIYLDAYNSLPHDFEFNVIKYDLITHTISFIQSEDFNDSEEPIIGLTYTVTKNDNTNFTSTLDSGIIYNKWLLVKDDYSGFDIDESKERTLL